ncbi:MAG TPA: hypothetical protein VK563_13670 [Puia sp.]|nr:hypothetical protein [Puia sp.]
MKQVSTFINFSRYRIVFLFVILASVASCQKPNNHIKKTVPLKAEFTTVSTILQAGPPELDSIAGQGTGTPVGKSSFVAHAQFDASNKLTGIIVATAENGDQFFANIQGHDPEFDDATGAITLHFQATIAGGTGKYAGATGSFAGIAHESIYNAAGSASWDGTITF